MDTISYNRIHSAYVKLIDGNADVITKRAEELEQLAHELIKNYLSVKQETMN